MKLIQGGRSESGWFAGEDGEALDDYRWQPCLQLRGAHIERFDAHFQTREACEEWIAENVIGQTWLTSEDQ